MDSKEILKQIEIEQNELRQKKQEVKKLIQTLQNRLDSYTKALESQEKSYRAKHRISPQIVSELVRSLVSAHKLEIDISSNLLRSYKEMVEIQRKIEQDESQEVNNEMLRELLKNMNMFEMDEEIEA